MKTLSHPRNNLQIPIDLLTSTAAIFFSMAERPLKIGIISGSQRPVQAGTQITDFIQAVIEKHIKVEQSIELVRINLGEVDLPLYDEPSPPMQITASDQYTKSTTQAWSRAVSPLNAFVVVTPEYNCNLPAGLKNAIDVLWHEWTTKPFMIVSYGVMGGTFAYEDLKRALSMAIKARVVDTGVHLQFGPMSKGNMIKAATGQDLGLTPDGTDHLWSDKRAAIIQAWQELVDLVNATGKP